MDLIVGEDHRLYVKKYEDNLPVWKVVEGIPQLLQALQYSNYRRLEYNESIVGVTTEGELSIIRHNHPVITKVRLPPIINDVIYIIAWKCYKHYILSLVDSDYTLHHLDFHRLISYDMGSIVEVLYSSPLPITSLSISLNRINWIDVDSYFNVSYDDEGRITSRRGDVPLILESPRLRNGCITDSNNRVYSRRDGSQDYSFIFEYPRTIVDIVSRTRIVAYNGGFLSKYITSITIVDDDGKIDEYSLDGQLMQSSPIVGDRMIDSTGRRIMSRDGTIYTDGRKSDLPCIPMMDELSHPCNIRSGRSVLSEVRMCLR